MLAFGSHLPGAALTSLLLAAPSTPLLFGGAFGIRRLPFGAGSDRSV